MPFNFYDTHTLLMAVQQLTPAATFLRDRYFPTNDASDIFATDDVLVEFRDGSKKLAPFVAPRKGGVTVLRAGRPDLDELRKRGFGEALYLSSPLSSASRPSSCATLTSWASSSPTAKKRWPPRPC